MTLSKQTEFVWYSSIVPEDDSWCIDGERIIVTNKQQLIFQDHRYYDHVSEISIRKDLSKLLFRFDLCACYGVTSVVPLLTRCQYSNVFYAYWMTTQQHEQ
jgi:hypothetical protein